MNDGGRPWRPGQAQKIDAIYAWVAEEPDGGEGVWSAQFELLGRPTHIRLVGADLARIKLLRPLCRDGADGHRLPDHPRPLRDARRPRGIALIRGLNLKVRLTIENPARPFNPPEIRRSRVSRRVR